ncbi:MAG TPA: ABC transporter ATP-binding protein [Eubacteriales bacterium]|nr:ABC transporter ATP-binding protein [Eubacteriales bacterium]
MATQSNILEIQNLSVRAGGKLLLDSVDLAIPYGEVHALLGQNGSGKTSLMMTIMGFSGYEVTQGRILFMGRDITALDVCERARLGIAIAQQRPPTIDGVKLRSVLQYTLRNSPDPDEALIRLAKEAQMERFLDRSINGGLSGGEIKRAELLQLLSLSPAFSMMDEPDSGVDIEALSLVGKLINKLFVPDETHPVRRSAGLIITHSGNILKYLHLDKAHVMHNGRIGCSGNPALIMETIGKYGYNECVRCIDQKEKLCRS